MRMIEIDKHGDPVCFNCGAMIDDYAEQHPFSTLVLRNRGFGEKTMTNNEIHEFVAKLEAKRDALNRAIDSLKVYIGLEGGEPFPGGGVLQEIRSDTFWGKTIPDATKQYLQMQRRPQTTQSIAEALQRGGLESKAGNFPAVVQTILRRVENQTEEIIRTPGGEWALAEWYPDRVRRRRPTAERMLDAMAEGKSAAEAIDEELALGKMNELNETLRTLEGKKTA